MEEDLFDETVLPSVSASNVDDALVTAGDHSLNGHERNELYERGKQFLINRKLVNALDCFLSCISGLTPKSGFAYLPQCLRKISEIYYGMEDYDKAVQFLQVEKMYYETALVDSAGMQKLMADKGSQPIDDTVPSTEDPVLVKAHEYARLSQLCLKEDRPELALEFCGKATQLYQKTYGESHPTTLKALDNFTLIYAEVGKQQYSDTARKYKEADSREGADQARTSKGKVMVGEGDPATVATHSAGTASEGLLPIPTGEARISPLPDDATNQNVGVDESVSESARHHAAAEQGPHPLVSGLYLFFGLWIICALGILGLLVVCESTDAPGFCADVRSKLRYWYLMASYYYREYRS